MKSVFFLFNGQSKVSDYLRTTYLYRCTRLLSVSTFCRKMFNCGFRRHSNDTRSPSPQHTFPHETRADDTPGRQAMRVLILAAILLALHAPCALPRAPPPEPWRGVIDDIDQKISVRRPLRRQHLRALRGRLRGSPVRGRQPGGGGGRQLFSPHTAVHEYIHILQQAMLAGEITNTTVGPEPLKATSTSTSRFECINKCGVPAVFCEKSLAVLEALPDTMKLMDRTMYVIWYPHSEDGNEPCTDTDTKKVEIMEEVYGSTCANGEEIVPDIMLNENHLVAEGDAEYGHSKLVDDTNVFSVFDGAGTGRAKSETGKRLARFRARRSTTWGGASAARRRRHRGARRRRRAEVRGQPHRGNRHQFFLTGASRTASHASRAVPGGHRPASWVVRAFEATYGKTWGEYVAPWKSPTPQRRHRLRRRGRAVHRLLGAGAPTRRRPRPPARRAGAPRRGERRGGGGGGGAVVKEGRYYVVYTILPVCFFSGTRLLRAFVSPSSHATARPPRTRVSRSLPHRLSRPENARAASVSRKVAADRVFSSPESLRSPHTAGARAPRVHVTRRPSAARSSYAPEKCASSWSAPSASDKSRASPLSSDESRSRRRRVPGLDRASRHLRGAEAISASRCALARGSRSFKTPGAPRGSSRAGLVLRSDSNDRRFSRRPFVVSSARACAA